MASVWDIPGTEGRVYPVTAPNVSAPGARAIAYGQVSRTLFPGLMPAGIVATAPRAAALTGGTSGAFS